MRGPVNFQLSRTDFYLVTEMCLVSMTCSIEALIPRVKHVFPYFIKCSWCAVEGNQANNISNRFLSFSLCVSSINPAPVDIHFSQWSKDISSIWWKRHKFWFTLVLKVGYDMINRVTLIWWTSEFQIIFSNVLNLLFLCDI